MGVELALNQALVALGKERELQQVAQRRELEIRENVLLKMEEDSVQLKARKLGGKMVPGEPCPKCGSKTFHKNEPIAQSSEFNLATGKMDVGPVMHIPEENCSPVWSCTGCKREIDLTA